MKKISILLAIAVIFSILTFSGCASILNDSVDKDKRVAITDGGLTFLCLRNPLNVYSDYSVKSQSWDFREGLEIDSGEEYYKRPYLKVQADIYSKELGDDRLFSLFDKAGSTKHSVTIVGEFYAFEGELQVLRYEFSAFDFEENVLDTTVRIYSDDELVGKVFFCTNLSLSQEYCANYLDKMLIKVSVNKYMSIEGTADLDFAYSSVPNISYAALDCLGLGDIRNWSECVNVTDYKSNISGGYDYVFWHGNYSRVKNDIEIEFTALGIDEPVRLKSTFYEYRGVLGSLELVFENMFL